MTTAPRPCPTCRSEKALRTLENAPQPFLDWVHLELGPQTQTLRHIGGDQPAVFPDFDRTLNPNVEIEYVPGGAPFTSQPFNVVEALGDFRCPACQQAWRVRLLSRLTQHVTQDSGAPNFDPVAYECRRQERLLELRLLTPDEQACVDVPHVPAFLKALASGLLALEVLWRPELEKLIQTKPAELRRFFQTTDRSQLPRALIQALHAWINSQDQ